MGAKSAGDVKCSAMCMLDSTHVIVEERTEEFARLFVVDLASGENILGSRWDDPATAPSLETLGEAAKVAKSEAGDKTDAGWGGPKALERTLLVDPSHIEGVPPKIEGVAIVDATTLALSNDDDFNFGVLDSVGDNFGGDQKTWIVLVRLAKALR